jgi:hypothetical protein
LAASLSRRQGRAIRYTPRAISHATAAAGCRFYRWPKHRTSLYGYSLLARVCNACFPKFFYLTFLTVSYFGVMSEKYKFIDEQGMYFVTMATVGWVDLFTLLVSARLQRVLF